MCFGREPASSFEPWCGRKSLSCRRGFRGIETPPRLFSAASLCLRRRRTSRAIVLSLFVSLSTTLNRSRCSHRRELSPPPRAPSCLGAALSSPTIRLSPGRHFASFPPIMAKPPQQGSGCFLPGGRPPVNVLCKGGRSPNGRVRLPDATQRRKLSTPLVVP
jgi:hypothetical protein